MTPTQRITDLESAAFRTDRRFDEAAESSELIRGAINELSVEVRELHHDLGEVTRVQQEQGKMLREILDGLGKLAVRLPTIEGR